MQAFSWALDELLDANNPLILTQRSMRVRFPLSHNYPQSGKSHRALPISFVLFCSKPRQWRRSLTAASEAYCQLVTLVREEEFRGLRLGPRELLANNCPRCFGPKIKSTEPDEPDVIVCCDGNFQHRWHKAASCPIVGHTPKRPELFIDPAAVSAMAAKISTMPSGRQREPTVRDELMV